jgi:hypothetical protein
MRHPPLLAFVLGLWLGGSVAVGAAVSYNFAGVADLFERNPRLAERAGFDPADTAAKKASLLWVHSSELNRVYFQAWNRAQILLGALALVLAVHGRARWLPVGLLAGAVGLVLYSHLVVEPQVADLGRQLDFIPRDPPPPLMPAFQELHGTYFMVDSVRFLLVLLAAGVLLVRGKQ